MFCVFFSWLVRGVLPLFKPHLSGVPHCLLDDISSWVENLIYSHICPTTMGEGGRGEHREKKRDMTGEEKGREIGEEVSKMKGDIKKEKAWSKKILLCKGREKRRNS
jgi:hypothetical protein